MLICEQYKALTGNLMVWALGPGNHPLRIILRSHIQDLSERSWGSRDFTWTVSKGGGRRSEGSTVWQNICIAWDTLKTLLIPNPPRNTEDWGNLPLWSPHSAHINPKLVRCKSQAQHRLRAAGMMTVSNISSPLGAILPWHLVATNPDDRGGRKAYESMVANLREIPDFPRVSKLQTVFFENGVVNGAHPGLVWQYSSPESDVTSEWQALPQRLTPTKAFTVAAGILKANPGDPPEPTIWPIASWPIASWCEILPGNRTHDRIGEDGRLNGHSLLNTAGSTVLHYSIHLLLSCAPCSPNNVRFATLLSQSGKLT